MGIKIQDLDHKESKELAEKLRSWEHQPSIKETYKDNEFAALGRRLHLLP
jgi:predicted flavoprotein YhiN